MRGSWLTVALIDCLVILSHLTFVKTTTVITRASFRRSLEYKQSILPDVRVDSHLNEQSRSLGGKHLRKSKVRAFKKRFRKQSDEVFGQNKPDVSKRDYFFAAASPYDRMTSPVDRRMFLVHRGERGPCFFHACHHGGMCIPRHHGFYCECLPGFIGTRCEVKKECRPETCKNGGTCTEIAVGRHLCTCPVGFLGDDCEARSPCHPNPCRNDGTCSQTDESYTCICEQGYKGKNCGIANKCSPNPCKNGGVCFEENNDYVCNCPQGFKGKTCEVISECNSVYCLNGGTCRDEPSGYKCDCRLGFYGKQCEVQTRLLWKPV
ncbi:adhesive plaque matrix protein 2-like isoform X2 [Orbicella faveolata]|uniref:adhesive plaque matrix protein 2-like isoform X2 n=1 Tax=Orbicella faveolata TaxID=48498 RepID=UPI0009E62048|nr:adhesive plaque matrix protein 2-like isoform X2 [Orbicella faveolata]